MFKHRMDMVHNYGNGYRDWLFYQNVFSLSLVSIYSKRHDHDTKDKAVEQSFVPLIALFWLKTGRGRGRNWL